jgi:glucan 1,3-beta-glucosidase
MLSCRRATFDPRLASEHHALYQYSLTGAINHFLGLIQTETPYYEPSPLPHQVSPYNVLFLDPLSSQPAAWGLWAALSDNILVFGAGLYSFFSNYTQSCEVGLTCQTQIINIDAVSEVAIYGLATVGTTWQVSMDQVGIINATRNPDGFQVR